MRKIIISLLAAAAFSAQVYAQAPETKPGMNPGINPETKEDLLAKKVLLPNGWSLTPAGHSLPLGDLPLNIAVSPSGHYIAVTNNGQSTQTLQLIDVRQEKVLDSVIIPKSWLGLIFSADEKFLYASGGNDNRILKYAVHTNAGPGQPGLVLTDSVVLGKPWPEKISPAGIDIDEKQQVLYVVTKENNSLYIVDLKAKSVLQRLDLGGEGYTCRLSPDRKELYITCWGCDKLLVFDTKQRNFPGEIPVGDNPNDVCLTKNGRWLFVANANDNSVSVIDVKNRKVVETLNAALYASTLSGSTSNALALSQDEKTLYVANADNNCLAVFDVSRPGSGRSKGFIPVG
jgi:YVTN family beta-propeller protein